MDLNKEIRETIAFYCGGTYENRKLATDKILQICKDKPLPIHGVVSSSNTRKALETIVRGYEGDGMENMQIRDDVFYKTCKEALMFEDSTKD
jgi:hypothetical protein